MVIGRHGDSFSTGRASVARMLRACAQMHVNACVHTYLCDKKRHRTTKNRREQGQNVHENAREANMRRMPVAIIWFSPLVTPSRYSADME